MERDNPGDTRPVCISPSNTPRGDPIAFRRDRQTRISHHSRSHLHRYGLHSYLAHGPIDSSPRAVRARFALATSSAWLHWASWSIAEHSPSVFLMAPGAPLVTLCLQTRALPSMVS